MSEHEPPEPVDDLDTKIMRSSAWAVLGYGGTQALSLLTMLLLARLLAPDDFGVVALALALLAVAQIAQESGLGAALIVYRGELRRAAACVLVFSPLVALLLYAVFFVGAPFAADFFDEPSLTSVLRVMALVLVLRGLTVMPLALLERSMRFGPITAVELSAGVAQAAAAIALAFAGAGVWSLVVGQLAFGFVRVVWPGRSRRSRPSPFEAQRETLRELMRYGRHVGVANLVNYCERERARHHRRSRPRCDGARLLHDRLEARVASGAGHREHRRPRRVPRARPRARRSRAVPSDLARERPARSRCSPFPLRSASHWSPSHSWSRCSGTTWRPAIVPLQMLALAGIVTSLREHVRRGLPGAPSSGTPRLHRGRLPRW